MRFPETAAVAPRPGIGSGRLSTGTRFTALREISPAGRFKQIMLGLSFIGLLMVTLHGPKSLCHGQGVNATAAPAGEPAGTPRCSCTDEAPSDDFTCAEQVEFGKCERGWMLAGRFCRRSCGQCACPGGLDCENMPPDSFFSCSEQVAFGKCDAPWMEGFCLLGCNRCPGGPLAPGVVPDAGGPGREPACPATPLEALAQDTTLQVFVQMVSRSDLDSLLNNMSAELTVFAPTNEAFERFVADPETGGADFLAGPVPELQRLLSLHVIPQVLDLDGLRRVSQLQTVDDDLAISVVQDGDTGPVRLESGGQQARLLRVDRRVCASIVHVVDNVLLHPALMPPLTLTVDGDGAQPGPEVALPAAPTTPVPQLPDALPPPFQAVGRAAAGDGSCRQLLEVLAETADLQRWAELVEASGLEDRLADPSWIVTMFAPTNAGIQLAEETLPALSEVLETSPDAVEVVVSYHIVPLHLSSWHLQRVTWLPTMVTDDLGRRLFLEANTGPSGIIGVGGRGTGSAAAVVVEDIPTCGGSLVQVVDSLLLPLQPVWMPDDSPAGARNASEAAQKLAPEAERPLPPASAG